MTQLPITHDAKSAWFQFVANMANPDLVAIVVFCTIGLLVRLNVALTFQAFGAVMEQF